MAKFNILIVGVGLGGLATAVALAQAGHQVTVLESTSELKTIGGGIGIAQNSMRAWDHLGLMERLKKAAGAQSPENRIFKRYNGDFLSDGKARNSMYKYDAVAIHRPKLQELLIEAADEAGVTIEVNNRVVEIDESGSSPTVITSSGSRIAADLIVGADGVKSTIRAMLHPNIELYSEYNVYRAVVSGAVVRQDPETASVLTDSTFWWGPSRVIASIPIQQGTALSLELTHPGDTGTAGDWSKRGDVEQMQATYADFEPVVVKLLEKVKPEDLLVWKLAQVPPLNTWIFPSGKVVLVADAAHAVMPYAGLGHAMAIEDGVALAECLSRASSTQDIPKALRVFEAIRKPRTKLIADFAMFNCKLWQLPDGDAQIKRDAHLRATPMFSSTNWDGKHVDEIPGMPPDPLLYPYLYGHDVVDFTRRKLDELWK